MIETTILENLEKLPESLKQEALHYIEFLLDKHNKTQPEKALKKKRQSGALKGTFVLPLPDDFDEPLADLKEYME